MDILFPGRRPIRAMVALAVSASLATLLASCGGGSSSDSASLTLPPPSAGAPGSPSASPAPAPSAAQRVASVPFASTPDPDPFYAQPASFPSDAPGTLLESRRITFAPARLPVVVTEAYQIRYVTRDVQGLPVAAVATVLRPITAPLTGPLQTLLAPLNTQLNALLGPLGSLGGLVSGLTGPLAESRLLVYSTAYDSLGAACAPSKGITGSTANPLNIAETPLFVLALARGYTVLLADYEGPTHAFGVGRQAGQANLDAIRAALGFAPLGLSPKTPVGLVGYSGGGIATAWTVSLAPRYAPELNLVGAASGGTPVDVFRVVKEAENTSYFNLVLGGVIGANRLYPQLIPDSLLNDKGRAVFNAMKDGCAGGTTDGSPVYQGTLAALTTSPDPYNTPGALQVRGLINLPQTGEAPKVPTLLYHEVNDELIQFGPAQDLYRTWCAAGSPIAFYPSRLGQNHAGGLIAGYPFALAFVEGRFAGQTLVPPGSERCGL